MEVIEGTNNAVEYLCNNKTNITIFIALIIAVFKITLEVIKFRSSLNDSKQKSDKIKSNIEIARYQVSKKDIIRDKKNQVASLQAALKKNEEEKQLFVTRLENAYVSYNKLENLLLRFYHSLDCYHKASSDRPDSLETYLTTQKEKDYIAVPKSVIAMQIQANTHIKELLANIKDECDFLL